MKNIGEISAEASGEQRQDRVGRTYNVFHKGKWMQARITGWHRDDESGEIHYTAVDASKPGEHMGRGKRFTVAESAVGVEVDGPCPGWKSHSPLSVDPLFELVEE